MITPEQIATSGSEDAEQAAFFQWCALNIKQYPQLKWCHAIPNGGSRHIKEAMKLVATGVKSGVWDVFLPYPYKYPYSMVSCYHGLYIEMKRNSRQKEKNGGLSDEQLAFGEYARSVGYKCVVCYGWQEAVKAIMEYLE